MNTPIRTLAAVATVFATSLLTTACGSGSIIQDVKVRAYTEGEELYGELKAQIQSGQLQIPSFTLPILDPRDPSQVLGSIGTRPVLGGGSELELDVNVSRAAKLQGADGRTLPNGIAIPIGVPGDVPVVGLSAGSRSRVYLAFGEGVAMLGVAVTIREFDGIVQKVPIPLNLFPKFKTKEGIEGVAGIFTSPVPGESGIAIFADVSKALHQDPVGMADGLARALGVHTDDAPKISGKSRLKIRSVLPSVENESRIYEGLYRLDRRKSSLSIE